MFDLHALNSPIGQVCGWINCLPKSPSLWIFYSLKTCECIWWLLDWLVDIERRRDSIYVLHLLVCVYPFLPGRLNSPLPRPRQNQETWINSSKNFTHPLREHNPINNQLKFLGSLQSLLQSVLGLSMPCIRCYTAGEEGVRVGGHGTNRGKWGEGTLHSHNIPYLTAQLNNNHNWLLRRSFVQSCLQWRRLLNLKATHHLSSSYLVRTNCSCFAYSSSRRRLWLLGCSWTDEEELHFYWWTFIVMAVNLLPENSRGQESGLDSVSNVQLLPAMGTM